MTRCRSTICNDLCVLLLAALLTSHARAEDDKADDKKNTVPQVLSPAPRDLRQRLLRAEEAIANQRYSDAVETLGLLLTAVAETDYFVTSQDSQLARGFRSELHRVLRDLPQPARETYESLFGVEAQQELNRAVEQQDLVSLAAIVQRWSHTRAADQAALLLARLDLDRGQPRFAAERLHRLGASWASKELEPERSMLLAAALLHIAKRDQASRVLEQLHQTHPDTVVKIGDEDTPLFAGDSTPLEVLAASVVPPASATDVKAWHLFRGDAAGSALRPETDHLTNRLWQREIDDEKLVTQQQDLADRDLGSLPVLSPLVVNGQVIVRTTQGLSGIDARTGKARWHYPPPSLAVVQEETEATDNDKPEEEARRVAMSTGRRQQVWSDACYGRISSDGQRLYFVGSLAFASDPFSLAQARQMAMFGQQEAPSVVMHNQLVAINVRREGAFAWMVGDETGESDPALAGVYFLGPPLPVADQLYILGEKENAISLYVLVADSGHLQWKVTLAQVDQQAIGKVPTRRFTGATPAYADGTLVCPTSAGAVAAVDLTARSLRWGFQYHTPPQRTSTEQRWIAAIGYAPRPAANGWKDPGVSIAGDSVLITIGGDDLYCLDLASGSEKWRRRRSDSLYAVPAGDRVLLIGTHRFAALRLSDGKPAWNTPFVAIPAGGTPSGRGLLTGGFYYLPTTDPELLKISLATGAIDNRQPLDAPLGNLCWTPTSIVSQGPATLTALGPPDNAAADLKASASIAPPQVENKPVDELTAMLGQGSFVVREAATNELRGRLAEALPALASSVHSDDTEVAQRTVMILVRLLDAKDGELAYQAREILRKTAAAAKPNAICANAFLRETRLREPAARAKLKELGATVKSGGRSVALRSTWKGDNRGLVHLRWLTKLESAELRNSKIDDGGLQHLRGIATLKTLNLNRTKITNTGLAHLGGLPGLRTLLLQGTQIDDGAIEQLQQIPGLRAINLSGTQFTAEGIEKLKAAMPDLKITF